MGDLVGTVAVFPLPATPFAAVLTGYVVLRKRRESGSSHPTWRGIGVAVGSLVAVPAAFFLVGRGVGRGWAEGLLSLGPLALLGVGVYLLAGGRLPAVFGLRNARKR